MKFFRVLFSRQWLLATLLVLAGGAVCIRLGIWQLDRLEGRREFNQHLEKVRQMDPLYLKGTLTEDLTQMEYRGVAVSGLYDYENQVALRNRYHENVFGYHLLTPLRLEDGSAVLIDRGWIPADGNDSPDHWRKYDQPGYVHVEGQIRQGDSKPDLGGVPDPTLTPGQEKLIFWNLVNLERIQGQLPYPLLYVYVQPHPEPGDSTPPIPYQPEIEISEGPHLGYAVQWFSFATILLFGYPFYLRRQMKDQ